VAADNSDRKYQNILSISMVERYNGAEQLINRLAPLSPVALANKRRTWKYPGGELAFITAARSKILGKQRAIGKRRTSDGCPGSLAVPPSKEE
jgi:hypothetical protein